VKPLKRFLNNRLFLINTGFKPGVNKKLEAQIAVSTAYNYYLSL